MSSYGRHGIPRSFQHTLIALATVAAFVLSAPSVHATSVVQLSDPQMVKLSSAVAEGKVTSVHSDWNAAHNQIYTTVTLQVSNQIKGTRPQGGVLMVKLLGGRVGDVVMTLIDQPVFRAGDDVIVFLDATSPQYAPITGLFQGKLTVAVDPATGTANVVERGMARDTYVRELSRIVAKQQKEGR